MPPGILTLTTDFGLNGPYVASMKGVILGRAPRTQIVDVSHSVRPQDVAEGSFLLASIFDCFPEGTVHLAVIDPGVGTPRRLVAVEVLARWFVLPDNGLISGVLRGREPTQVREIRNEEIRRGVVSATFHGRDILGPAAAHLLLGGDPGQLGPIVEGLILLGPVEPARTGGGLDGEVIAVDPFGNLITNITRADLGASDWSVKILGRRIQGMTRTYGESTPGTLVALVGSTDRVEVAVVNGNAATNLGADRGTTVRLRPRQERRP